ncbi:hypothetical protein H6G54_04060 [Anabaena cylindrica FACHB-243]|uniref:Uncharacterized protein n=1 Tax=Anabaena cylindrica (strain ATCC 27899 / PCC 7122) TaxID=272123 RepID=K9ZHS9_ANACC|nr:MULTISPECIES: hypothetical protein [Anabaena]AFZ58309.1 hypothetical protein Anacy_2885 [Anabaena cylindrica PCC 7122]MBD2416901.1 hypothetical protein [Anabaena cylindrica FACHB-243]MBY5281912.1 hypothetical protein [Anabaena sp. CCAP 1446/1C]MBY5308612.1 hypothetical protein [Anabaena sp. CCAP 1446/1C]MCM2406433.1 hypothetical protein [Anabaena sp. CCAP 1446/1C]
MSQDKQPKPRGEQEIQPSQKPYQKNQPIWKVTIIQFLRGTIGILENTLVKLETQQPSSTEIKPNILQRVLSSWDGFLRTFRLFLPSNVSNNVSDTVLTGIFAVITVVIVLTTSVTIFSSKPAEIATLPPVEEVATPTSTVIEPEPSPTPTQKPETIPEPIQEVEPTPTPVIEPEAQPIKKPELIPVIEPEPTPVIELTPEQTLIVAIENQLAEISIPIKSTQSEIVSSQLIKSIQANFRTSDLTIKISDDWYTLEASQQNQLAADIFQRSQELDFSHLEIIDLQDRLVARSPVVGNEMVIFKRQTLIN